MLLPSRFTAIVETLLTTARVPYDSAGLVRWVRRHWPAIAADPDAVRSAIEFAATQQLPAIGIGIE